MNHYSEIGMRFSILSQNALHLAAKKNNFILNTKLPMITKTTEQIEANIQKEMTSPFHALAQEMKVSNALKRQQIQATKDQNKLIAILVRVQEEGLGLNDNGWQYKNGNLASEIVSQYDS